ncbi:Cupin superfamily protein [Bradyrhizobium brasilense]|uniref:Cupin superfamily protein n=1 Tax=Bradyrhizobium brasilense TaxID=1419277 RepID=A0A1G6RY98_9BRAD|nr:cupin domain-containing protein [Bradyrhizobium brasilense]SDD09423.1 Cupin superfamily protein [Bradyrhizobium brasilense]
MASSSHISSRPPQAFSDPLLALVGAEIFAAMFGELSFAEIECGQRPIVRRGIHFRDLPNSTSLWAMIDAQTLSVDHHEIRLVRTDGNGLRVVPPADYAVQARRGESIIRTPLPARARSLYGQGATIAFQRLDRHLAEMARLCAALSACLGHPMQCSAYLSPPGCQGLDIHHDTHDIIVFQIEGSKTFQLFDVVVDLPVPRIDLTTNQAASAQPTQRVELAAGDVLYLPRGVPHCAVAGDQESLHLTFGILAQSWASLVEPLARELYFIEPLRRAPATREIFDGDVLQQSAATAVGHLIEWLQAYGAERIAALACETYVKSFEERPAFAGAAQPPAFAIEPAPDDGYYRIEPGRRDRLSAAEIRQWTNREDEDGQPNAHPRGDSTPRATSVDPA